jgi:hypothetical protein
MAEATDRPGDGNLATELPSKHLPAVEYRDLPEPVSVWKIVGASAIISATALGSGEFILWPLIVSQVGFTIFWAAILGFFFQFILNMEIERYALVTGETAVTGFARLWRHWGLIFIIMALVPNLWPGWATGSSTTITFWAGLGGGAVTPITVIMLISIGIALTVSPVVYQTVEKVQGAAIVLILIFIVAAVITATSGEAWGSLAQGSTAEFGQNIPAAVAVVGASALAGAVAFAGAGGANNLVQANYIRDKEMGMGAYIPNIVSPLTGEGLVEGRQPGAVRHLLRHRAAHHLCDVYPDLRHRGCRARKRIRGVPVHRARGPEARTAGSTVVRDRLLGDRLHHPVLDQPRYPRLGLPAR